MLHYSRFTKFWLLAILTVITIVIFADQCEAQPRSGERSEKLQELLDWIRTPAPDSGSPRTDLELAEKLIQTRSTHNELTECWKVLSEQQSPIISKQDLIELIETKRAAIHDLHYKYRFRHDRLEGAAAPIPVFQEENTFASSGSKLYIHSSRIQGANSAATAVCSYDANFVRYVDLSRRSANGSIRALSGRADFFRVFDGLARSMLLKCTIDLQQSGAHAYDLVELLKAKETILLQSLEEADGRMCLVATEGVFRVYLDPQCDFSVVRLDGYTFVSQPVQNGGAIIGYKRISERTLHDCINYDNGLWLPSKTIVTFFKNDKAISRETTDVSEVRVNKGVDESLFADVIPVGTTVFDSIRGATYTYGSDATIEGTLSSVAHRHDGWSRIVFIVINVIAALVLGWMVWRRRLQRAR
jgi:hypothetical protein